MSRCSITRPVQLPSRTKLRLWSNQCILHNGVRCGSWCVRKRKIVSTSSVWDSLLSMMKNLLWITVITCSPSNHKIPYKWNLMKSKITKSSIGSMTTSHFNSRSTWMDLRTRNGTCLWKWCLICRDSRINCWVISWTRTTSIFSIWNPSMQPKHWTWPFLEARNSNHSIETLKKMTTGMNSMILIRLLFDSRFERNTRLLSLSCTTHVLVESQSLLIIIQLVRTSSRRTPNCLLTTLIQSLIRYLHTKLRRTRK